MQLGITFIKVLSFLFATFFTGITIYLYKRKDKTKESNLFEREVAYFWESSAIALKIWSQYGCSKKE